jgi:hypothetical protein
MPQFAIWRVGVSTEKFTQPLSSSNFKILVSIADYFFTATVLYAPERT